MLNIVKQKINLSPDLKRKIEWAKNYTSVNVILEYGALIRLEPTNIAYVEPHKVKIKEYTFLFFNDNNYFYENNLETKHKLNDIEKYFKIAKNS